MMSDGPQILLAGPRAVLAHERQQLVEGGAPAGLVVAVDGRDRGVVELVELVVELVGELVLALLGDADDHAWPSSSCLDSAGAAPGGPSSAFILASSSSTAAPLDSSLS